MTDDELRRALTAAHEADAPPPVHGLLGRARRAGPARRAWLVLAPAAAAALAALLLLPERRPRPALPPPVEVSYPLDFLLDVPGDDLLHDTPRFELKGNLP